jgi:hypothetical protein
MGAPTVGTGVIAIDAECEFDRTVWGGPMYWSEVWTTLTGAGLADYCDSWPVGSEFPVEWYNETRGGSAWFPQDNPNEMVAQETFYGYVNWGAGMYVNGGGGAHLIDPDNPGLGEAPDWYCPPGATTFRLLRNGTEVASVSNSAPGSYPGAPIDPGIGNTLLWSTYEGNISVGDVFVVTCTTLALTEPTRLASGVVFYVAKRELV